MTEIQSIGSQIRRLRKIQQRTLQDIADECGFTKSLLSKIEGEKVIPPVATLVKIANALNTSISALVANGNSFDCVFTKANQTDHLPVKTANGYSILPLAVEYKQKKMQPFIFTALPADIKGKMLSHKGEEFLYIIEGEMQFQVGSITYTMGEGDNLYFNSLVEHKIVAVLSDHVKYINIFC